MKQSDKLKVLIDSLKTSNEIMKKQIERSNRTIELIGDLIIEPESIEPTNIKPEDMVSGEWYVFGLNIDKTQSWLLKFKHIINNEIYFQKCLDLSIEGYNLGVLTASNMYFLCNQIEDLRPATQEEILRYFPNELEVPTHGGNDAGYIQEVTDPQV